MIDRPQTVSFAETDRIGASGAADTGLNAAAPAAVAARMRTTLTALLRDLAAAPNGAAFANPAVARGLEAIVAAALATGGAAAKPVPAPLTALAALVRTALFADPRELDAIVAQLRMVFDSDPAAAAAALASAAPAVKNAQAVTAIPAVVSLFDQPTRALARGSSSKPAVKLQTERGTISAPAVTPIPECDPYGRRYSDSARRRLRELGCEPRRGFAPEAQVAFAAEERWGWRFVRAVEAGHHFVDDTGNRWNVVSARCADGLAATLHALTAGGGVLLTTADAPAAERTAIFAIVARCAAGAAHPIVAVDVETEEPWPGS